MLFSGVFVVLLVWLGTREVIGGELTIGQLISFLGYALFMVYPIQTFFEFAQKLTRARCRPARRSRSSSRAAVARRRRPRSAAGRTATWSTR